jgi:hypothetical protein
MAGGVIGSFNGKNYPGNLTCKVLVTCIVAAMGGLIFGYDLGISGNVRTINIVIVYLPSFHIINYFLFITITRELSLHGYFCLVTIND